MWDMGEEGRLKSAQGRQRLANVQVCFGRADKNLLHL
jgi:hypothetical protein